MPRSVLTLSVWRAGLHSRPARLPSGERSALALVRTACHSAAPNHGMPHNMPAKNPRLSVVLPPSVAATLATLAEETGQSASSLARSILEQTAPSMVRMLELVRAAKAAQGQIGAGMAASMDRVVDDLADAMAVAHARADRISNDLVFQAENVKGRRSRGAVTGEAGRGAVRAPTAQTPRLVTRGVGSGKTRLKGVKGGKDGSL